MIINNSPFRYVVDLLAIGICIVFISACDSVSPVTDEEDCQLSSQSSGSCSGLMEDGIIAIYEIAVENASHSESFRIALSTGEQVEAAEQAIQSTRKGVISGVLKLGDGGFNVDYSWHLDPASVSFPDVAMELCDGGPNFVEADTEYWIENVGVFCPWGAEVVRRIEE